MARHTISILSWIKRYIVIDWSGKYCVGHEKILASKTLVLSGARGGSYRVNISNSGAGLMTSGLLLFLGI
jgi:hypothetical protein